MIAALVAALAGACAREDTPTTAADTTGTAALPTPADTAAPTSPPPAATTLGASSVTTPAPVTEAPPTTSPAITGQPTETAPPAISVSAATTTAPVATVPSSPLSEYLPLWDVSDEADQERWQRVNEDAKAACMAAEGFEYVPFIQVFKVTPLPGGGAMMESPDGAGPGRELPDDQYAAQYGYGLSTVSPSERSTRVDPNKAIVDAMSVAERVAYHHALFGTTQSLDDAGHLDGEISFGDLEACWHQGREAAGAAFPEPESDALAEVNAAFAGLLEQLGAIYEQAVSDPRVTAANQRWSDCVAAAGYPGYTDLNEPHTDIAARARALMGDALDPANADPGELADLQRLEIGLAVADNACRGEYGTTYDDVTRELQEQFVDQHRAELEEYRDAVAALGG